MPSSDPVELTPTADVEPLLVSVAEAARMLGLSRSHVYVLLDRGLIESRFYGRRRLVPVAAVAAFASELPTERTG